MDSKLKSKIELTRSAEDWEVIRECYVKSFLRYPLYKYMVSDPSKREEFLRAYLNANYDVTVGSGQGILLAIKVLVGSGEEARYKVVGGVIFVPPSSDGCGWAIGSDEPYWQAYEKYQLARISAEGLERVKRYESWENENIAQKASGTRIPLWNGLFCAIEPDYASKGVGSAVYKEAIRIMARFWIRQQTELPASSQEEFKLQEKSNKHIGSFSKIFFNSSFKNINHYALLHHRVTPSTVYAQKKPDQQLDPKNSRAPLVNRLDSAKATIKEVSIKSMMYNSNAPLVVAVSHSEIASRFHQSNGFQPVLRIPFYDATDDVIPFYTHVLVLDPFCTGKLSLVEHALLPKESSCSPDSKIFLKDLKSTSHMLL